jgi:hypothetical protein
MTDPFFVGGLQDATVDHRDIAPVRHPCRVRVAPIQRHLPNYHHTVVSMWWSNQDEVRIGCHSETALQNVAGLLLISSAARSRDGYRKK